ncbi:hypothetical protein BHU72_14735 [Desulfuribacillus stibiiarsenatis]|uniref:SAF domain-containing protein n=1 Tax=Desulfuribacillus stibiiarsenatis TaxID=1390249 RepID=A0A1E5L7A9_9FIRM|nr:hypothetical protein [Desulfuribacillus stibiiarsenatis]OEH86006.1 hypothetical protein BHU72_14735 [Desulfuribacillus stibiiarsenatis]
MKKFGVLWVLLIFAIAAFLSQNETVADTNNNAWYPVIDLPPGAIIKEKDIVQGKAVIRADEGKLLADKEQIVGKQAIFGIKKGYGITSNTLQSPGKKYHEISIPIKLDKTANPETLKVAALWIDYDQKRFPNRPSEYIGEVVVTDMFNNRGISIYNDKTNQKLPISAGIYIEEQRIVEIISKGQQGEFRLTNPYYVDQEGRNAR